MKKILLLIPLVISSLFCSVGNIPESQPDSAFVETPPIASASQPSVMDAVPSLVWLPYEHSSASHDNKLLTVRNGIGSFEQAPVDVGVFWEYTALTGRLAYASDSKIGHVGTRSDELAVSDLWVYDYPTGKSEMWLPNDVVNARWSPVIDPKTSKQYLAAVLYNTTLVLLNGPNEPTLLSENASFRFSWSPDGRYIAYIKDNGLYVITIDGGETKHHTNVLLADGGWIGDKPIWIAEPPALLYSKVPIEIALMDGSSVFVPKMPDGKSPATERAFNILWSQEKRILAFDVEDINQTTVWVYELSPDLETIVSNYSFNRMESNPIADWWVSGESILLRTGEIWSISEKTIIDKVH